MKSPSWASSNSISFWRGATIKQGVVLGKNLVVGGTSVVEKAATTCRSKSKVVEKTQATIDAATLEGIPNNIDLFKVRLLFSECLNDLLVVILCVNKSAVVGITNCIHIPKETERIRVLLYRRVNCIQIFSGTCATCDDNSQKLREA